MSEALRKEQERDELGRFGSGGGESDKGTMSLPLCSQYNQLDGNVDSLANDIKDIIASDGKAVPETINPSALAEKGELQRTQDFIDHSQTGFGEPVVDGHDDHPIIALINGGKDYVILDGHHRIDSALKTGATIKAYVYDLDFFGKLAKLAPTGVKHAKGKTYVDVNRKMAQKAQKAFKKTLALALTKLGRNVAKQVATKFKGLGKADTGHGADDIEDILRSLNINFDEGLSDELRSELEEVYATAGEAGLAQLGVQMKSDLVNQVNDRAAVWARDHAADLVGINEDSEYWIADATREMLRGTITSALEEGIPAEELSALIEEGYAFSEERASLIAETEIATANGQGALAGYAVAEADGLKVGKSWLILDDACDDCQENEDAGIIALDEDFPSGDPAPPAHPNCRCVIVPEVADDAEEGDAVDEEVLDEGGDLELMATGALRKEQERDENGRFAGGGGSSGLGFMGSEDHALVAIGHSEQENLANAERLTEELGHRASSNAEVEVESALLSSYDQKYMVEYDGNIVAAIAYGEHPSENYVMVDHLGSMQAGLGRALMEEAKAYADEKKLDLVLQSSDEAHGFYEALGMESKYGGGDYWSKYGDTLKWDSVEFTKYSEDQPRDENGRFGFGGEGHSAETKANGWAGRDLKAEDVHPEIAKVMTPEQVEHLRDVIANKGDQEQVLNAMSPIYNAIKDGPPDTLVMEKYKDAEGNTQERIPGGFFEDRTYNVNGEQVKLEPAVEHLITGAEAFSSPKDEPSAMRYNKEAFIVVGPSAAGKSGLAEQIAIQHGAAIVDSDEAKKIINEYNGGIGANAVHEESSAMSRFIEQGITDRGGNLVVPTVGANASGPAGRIDRLKELGYKVTLVDAYVTKDEATRRMASRAISSGRPIGAGYVRGVGDHPTRTYDSIKGKADAFMRIDANGPKGSERITESHNIGGQHAGSPFRKGQGLREGEDTGASPGGLREGRGQGQVQPPLSGASEEVVQKALDGGVDLKEALRPLPPHVTKTLIDFRFDEDGNIIGLVKTEELRNG